MRLLILARQFQLPGGGWLILGRNKEENSLLKTMAQGEDAVLSMSSRPGPTAILRRAAVFYENDATLHDDLRLAASLLVRFGRKPVEGPSETDACISLMEKRENMVVSPLTDHVLQEWAMK